MDSWTYGPKLFLFLTPDNNNPYSLSIIWSDALSDTHIHYHIHEVGFLRVST